MVYAINSFENPTVPGASTGLHEYDLGLGLNLGYEFTRWCSAEASYNYDVVYSFLPGGGFERNRVALGLRLTY